VDEFGHISLFIISIISFDFDRGLRYCLVLKPDYPPFSAFVSAVEAPLHCNFATALNMYAEA